MNKVIQKNQEYKKFTVDSRLQYYKPHSTKIEKTFAEEISDSLRQVRKSINPKFFYDKKGSELFENICILPEYYLTRSEIHILKSIQDELATYLDDGCRLVELGSGSSTKTRLILDVLNRTGGPIEYIPIDISEILTESSEQLLASYDMLHITGIVDTYDGGLEFLSRLDGRQNLTIFLGSSYGNFEPYDGRDFLRTVYSAMKTGDLFLIGLDLVKDKKTLESAYNDSLGVTSAFNLNVLTRINDELDADFDLENFEHIATYNQAKQRIEMYVKSLVGQSVIIAKSGQQIRLRRGELIHTEYSHKFEPRQIHDILQDAGFDVRCTWYDEKKYFALTLASRGQDPVHI